MAYVTSVERIGIKKGIELGTEQGFGQGLEQGLGQGLEQGFEQNACESIIEILEDKFGEAAPDVVVETVATLTDLGILKTLLKHAAKSVSMDQFMQAFEKIIQV